MLPSTAFKQVLTLSLLTLLALSCKKKSDDKKSVASNASSADSDKPFDESTFTNEQRILDPEFGKNVAGPDSPSTMMILESSESDSRIIDVSLALNVWGAGTNSNITTNLMMQYTPGITLNRHTPKGDNSILDAEGNIIWNDENKPVAQCNYDAMVISSATGVGGLAASPKIPFIGTGAGITINFEKSVEDMSLISGTSNYFPVRKGETIAAIQEMCRTIFDAANKDALSLQLKTLVEKKFIMDERKGFEKVMKQALGGPKEILQNVNGLDFNVDEILATVKSGGKDVVGGIKGAGETVKDKIGDIIPGIGLITSFFAEESKPTFDLCFHYHLDINNTILDEQYNDCHGGAIDSTNPLTKRAIEVAQEIGMTSGQYAFSAKDF